VVHIVLDNDIFNYAWGYIVTDLNGDQIADGSDMAILDNNLLLYLYVIKPDYAPGYIKDIFKIKRQQIKAKLDANVKRNPEKGTNDVIKKQK
jgi:hypothetical protein